MEVIIKPAAAAQLNEIKFHDNEGVRIEATYVGSCAIYADYSLLISKKGEVDELFVSEGIPVFISKESQRFLYHRIYLDYTPNLGYKLSSDEETYRYNLQIKHI